MATFLRPERPIATGRRTTITDVARAAGVSIAVVSYALNGRPGVSDRTRRRVLQVAEELGWRPSVAARTLRGAAGSVALVLVRDAVGAAATATDLELSDGLRDVLDGRLSLAVHLLGSPAAAALAIADWWAEQRYDAVVLTGIRREDPRLAAVERLGAVAVLVDHVALPGDASGDASGDAPSNPPPAAPRPPTPTSTSTHTVALDPSADTKVGRYLSDLGHRRVAVLASAPDLRSGRGAAEAVSAEVTRRGGVAVVESCTTLEDVASTARRLLASPERPTAVVTSDDQGALVVLDVARRAGLAVPWDLSVVAGRDAPVLRLSTPPVTAVARPDRALGQEAGRRVLRTLGRDAAPGPGAAPAPSTPPGPGASPGGSTPRVEPLPAVPGGRLVVRGTTSPPR
ncbi:LacI family DNA-binding transcriptional regulator [Oerskovia enterophila]|uniref:LacI family DNA-binding transcriptional regulator n=1 Tax=Oerskovia enterophila TaxID=43678 RepID=UPI00382C9027